MRDLGSPTNDLVNAVLSYEFDGGEVDVHAIDRVRDGENAEWMNALSESGMFSDEALVSILAAWQRDPELLVDALLGGADEVSRRRLKAARRKSLFPARVADFA
ncbi:hypothetical protein [Rhodococcus tukisamuensis]|uniref:Uncharacterized protein n=1 Tax=Rhodococcus tukisamuensis TaxID=168276 RepID=A0A1G7B8J0_9NOCA|nr:hypothetical protein [Rhodococcus tukisamuensis]SDE23438.1 hypothetical protein SAMN05444580_112127 [Rhodococcus tukisamuensis]